MKKKLVLMTSALMAVSLLAGCGSQHSHEYKLVAEVAATCTESGVHAHYTCEGCDKLFDEDKNETTVAALTIAALGHDYKFDSFVWAADYSAQAKHVCSRDNKHVELRDATVTSKVTKDATCEEDGVETYTATYDTHTETKEKVLSKLGHAWSDPTYEWSEDGKSCTATVICGNDSAHKIEETVECTYKVLEVATEEADGKGQYTATFENEKFTTQEKEVAIESLPTLSKLAFTSNGDGTYSVKSKDSDITGRVKIPSTYGDDEAEGIVTSISDDAFFGADEITEMFIPSTLKTIGSNGFYRCEKMTDVHFAENSVLESVGEYAFQRCYALVSVAFPKSVKTLGRRAFDELTNLESVVFEEGNELESIGSGCFYDCPKLKTITFAETSKFKELDYYTFQKLGVLEELDLPNSVETIKTYSIHECSSLKTLWLSKELKSFEYYSIDSCPIENLHFKGTMEEWNKISKEGSWCSQIATNVVHCTDGDVAI